MLQDKELWLSHKWLRLLCIQLYTRAHSHSGDCIIARTLAVRKKTPVKAFPFVGLTRPACAMRHLLWITLFESDLKNIPKDGISSAKDAACFPPSGSDALSLLQCKLISFIINALSCQLPLPLKSYFHPASLSFTFSFCTHLCFWHLIKPGLNGAAESSDRWALWRQDSC